MTKLQRVVLALGALWMIPTTFVAHRVMAEYAVDSHFTDVYMGVYLVIQM